MGCTDSRTTIPDEERAIVISSNHVGFKDCSSQKIDYKLRKYSANRLISFNQLENIIQNLRLSPLGQSKHIDSFYKSYDLNQTQELDFVKFVMTGIILGCESPESKAKLLFEIFDVHSDGKLPKEQIKFMIEILVSVSLDHIPLLVDNERNPPASELLVEKYVRKISKFRSNLITNMEKKLANTEIVRIKEFAEKFESVENEIYMNDSSIRLICFKDYSNYRKAKKLKVNKGVPAPVLQLSFETPGNTPGNTAGYTPGNTPGNTPGYTPGNTPGYTPGNTPGYTPDYNLNGHISKNAQPAYSYTPKTPRNLPNHSSGFEHSKETL